MMVQILVDNINSWIVPFAEELRQELVDLGHDCILKHEHDKVEHGDLLCLLGCEKVFKERAKNNYNLVVHESDLPKGKGWSPLTWQILEGENRIPITLFEAEKGVDCGDIYLQDEIALEGHELFEEIKNQQGIKTKQLIHKFISNIESTRANKQVGEETFYRKRKPEDSEIDINKSIKEQFNLLRVVDNDRYPAYFVRNGIKYIIKIYKG